MPCSEAYFAGYRQACICDDEAYPPDDAAAAADYWVGFWEAKDRCPCGSGLYAPQHHDARGIFLTYACHKCEDEKLAGYRPEVLTDPNYYHDEPLEED